MNAIEKFLRMDRFQKSGDIVRMRAIYIAVLAFILVQFINIAQMVYIYEGWSLDANIAVAAICFMVALLVSYRYHARFIIAAIGITGLMIVGIGFSAIEYNTGVNSALLPFLPVCIAMCGLISGWRTALMSGLTSIGFIIGLFVVSHLGVGNTLYDPAIFASQNFQRASQVTLACIMIMIIMASYTYGMHGLFQRDEDSLVKIREAEISRTKFFSALSHEIRTPLNGIVGMSGLLLRSDLTSQQQQYAQIVNDCSENLLDVMSNVMEITQLDNDRIDLKPTRFDIHGLSEDLIAEHKSSLADKPAVNLALHIAPSVPKYLHADHKRVRLIMNHLLRNAVKFTQKGTVSLIVDGNVIQNDMFKLCVYVRDTGVGIKKDDLSTIYDRFHQLDNSLSRKYEGSGLGLAICKELIDFMGGNLNAVSEVGIGSTFYFDLIVTAGGTIGDAEKSHELSQTHKKTSAEHSLENDDGNIVPFKKAAKA